VEGFIVKGGEITLCTFSHQKVALIFCKFNKTAKKEETFVKPAAADLYQTFRQRCDALFIRHILVSSSKQNIGSCYG
jgi:hypothetical protein